MTRIKSKRRTKKVAAPSQHEFFMALFSMVGTPDADAVVADAEAAGATGFAAYLRQFFREAGLERRVGLWEDRHTNQHAVWLDAMAACPQYVNQLWSELGYADPPVITSLSAEETAERPNLIASSNAKEIRLPGDHSNANLDTVVLHEASHVIAKRLGICDGHGPIWLGIYFTLLERLSRIDMSVLKAAAMTEGLAWIPWSPMAELAAA